MNQTAHRPTQEEAQFMIDWFNAIDEIHTGYLKLNSEFKTVFEQADKIRSDLWRKTFNETTRWKAQQTYFKNGNRKKIILIEIPEGEQY